MNSNPDPQTELYKSLIGNLLTCLGIAPERFQEAIAWSLCEHMVTFLAADRERLLSMRNDRDFLLKFGEYLKVKTGRKWSLEDAQTMRERLFAHIDPVQPRQAIAYEDWLHLLFTTPLRCSHCGKGPPEVILEIDHIFPSSKGGNSKASNLRFLCKQDNRKKSDKLEATKPWLNLR